MVLRTAEKKPVGKLPSIEMDGVAQSDMQCLAIGAFSPLSGFMNQKDYESVLYHMRLLNGLVWTIPITLMVSKEMAKELSVGSTALLSHQKKACGLIEINDIYIPDKLQEAQLVYRTTDLTHPGVKTLMNRPEVYIGGKISAFSPDYTKEPIYFAKPAQTRDYFSKNRWYTIAGFQTRNPIHPIHRAHEYLQKTALEIVDGLLVHPLMGVTKDDDIPSEVRWKCYAGATYPLLSKRQSPAFRFSWVDEICRSKRGCVSCLGQKELWLFPFYRRKRSHRSWGFLWHVRCTKNIQPIH